MANRQNVPAPLKRDVLAEAGYRCAVPTCRTILAIDLHHLVHVSEGGENDLGNLIALCPTCHALYHRGEITRDALYAWKGMLVSLSNAFDRDAIDNLLFLGTPEVDNLRVSGDGVLNFTSLIAAGLASFSLFMQNGPVLLYEVTLTTRGRALVDAWRGGDRAAVAEALEGGAA